MKLKNRQNLSADVNSENLKSQPLIGINLLYIRPGYMGGTVRYVIEIIKYFAKTEDFRWIIYIKKDALLPENLANLPTKEFKIIGGLLGRVIFEQGMLPVIAQKDKVDLLFSPGFVSPLWGRFAKVITIHDMYYKKYPQFVRTWQRRYWQLFVPLSIHNADLILANSLTTQNDIASVFPKALKKIRSIYLGADATVHDSDATAVRQEDNFCLVVAKLTPNKNIETIVEAFTLLKERQQSIKLIVAGCDLFGRLKLALQKARCYIDIKLLEHIDDATLIRLYKTATCLIQASHYEGFGLPVAEAMHQGCPVIVSKVPVLEEICGEAALFFPPDSAEALANNITKLIQDEKLRLHYKTLGIARAQKFKWENTAAETIIALKACLQSPLHQPFVSNH